MCDLVSTVYEILDPSSIHLYSSFVCLRYCVMIPVAIFYLILLVNIHKTSKFTSL